jgi:ferric-dicitrate binding protein FerR (iron transport regulator)
MDPEGNKLNQLEFEQGYASFHFMPEHRDVYTVRVANATLAPSGKSTFRTDFAQDQLRVEVFSGAVELAATSGSVKVSKHELLEYSPKAAQPLSVQHGIQKDSWDVWAEAPTHNPRGH